jgi:hypothetical protein
MNDPKSLSPRLDRGDGLSACGSGGCDNGSIALKFMVLAIADAAVVAFNLVRMRAWDQAKSESCDSVETRLSSRTFLSLANLECVTWSKSQRSPYFNCERKSRDVILQSS